MNTTAVLRIYWLEAKLELLKNLRLPVFSLSTLLFPLMFYLMFGLGLGRGDMGPVPGALYFAVAYAAFGVVGASLFGLGVNVAIERGQGWTLLRRAFPAPPLSYFTAKVFMAAAFSLVIIVVLLTLALTIGGARLAVADAAILVLALLAGTLPFCAMGLALGYLLGANSAPAVVNLIYLPMAFGGGMWVPLRFLPDFMQTIAPYLPTYHTVQLALGVVGAGSGGSVAGHLLVLGLVTAACLSLAVVLYFRRP